MKRAKFQRHHVISGVVLAALAGGVYMLATQATSRADSTIVPPAPDSTPIEAPITPPAPVITYRSIEVTSQQPGGEISAEVGLKNVPFVLTFNRLDEQHIRTNTTITIPSTFTDWDVLSPFPTYIPAAKEIPKLLMVSQRVQAIGAYENGHLVRWMVTSTGKKDTPTPNKLYFTNWKGKLVTSSIEDEWILPWYFNLDNMDGISMHQYELPGYPASHSCVRMTMTDAEWVYNWADQWILGPDGNTKLASGTPVIVFGEYAYGKTAPWKKLATDPDASTLSVDELTEVINKNISEIQAEAQKRAEIEAGA